MNREQRLYEDGVADVPPVLFYHEWDSWGVFSNFSDHPVELRHPFTNELVVYPTGEHRYQAMKTLDHDEHDAVWEADTPGVAKHLGRTVTLRDDWGKDYLDVCWWVMLETVTAKAIQNQRAFDALLNTADRPIYEDSPTDDIWGWRYRNDYRGKNLLGRCLMSVRDLVISHEDLAVALSHE